MALRMVLLALLAIAGTSLAGIITTEPGGNPVAALGMAVAAVATVLFLATGIAALRGVGRRTRLRR